MKGSKIDSLMPRQKKGEFTAVFDPVIVVSLFEREHQMSNSLKEKDRSPILIHFTAFRGWVQWVGSRFDNDWAGGYSSGKWCASRVVHGYGSNGELEVWFRRVVQGCCNGMTPLHVSVCQPLRAEDTSTLKKLLEHNSDCSSKDDASEMS
ncbi:cbxX/CfqX [Artemisia annua]|uniref:CbxX/CfqX n=1 Tax=Artemisia annua TaxID=35608 RepID=A0A2U1KJG4_ARTAN|nr:cbxX/CfqX [Artemisia annua]